MQIQLQKAVVASPGKGPDFDGNIAPFLALRERYPDDLFVNEQYQDGVARNGIEGHFKALVAEYQALDIKHPEEKMYHYLFLRSLVGRSTNVAILALTDMTTQDPSFAPAHRTLAQIYDFLAFRDPVKQKAEAAKFLALCPGSQLVARPIPLPEPSLLVDQAEQLLSRNGDPDRIIAMTFEGLRSDEWRNQRIRALDSYTLEFKRKALSDLRDEYWKAWSIQVRCHWKAGRQQQAAGLLASMEENGAALGRRDLPGYWEALVTIARLYIEAGQMDRAGRTIERMQQHLSKNPDAKNAAVLDSLRKLVSGSPGRS